MEQKIDGEPFYLKGRPIYIDAYAYPYVDEGGHIHQGEYVMLFKGREKLDLEDLKNDTFPKK